MRAVVLLVAVLGSALAACGDGDPISDHDVELRVVTEAREVELGRAFPVTVVRAWRRELEPDAWEDDALAPLDLRLLETTRREDDTHVEETRRYDAYAFELGEAVVPAPSFEARPRGGGAPVVARGRRIDLLVRGALDPDDRGEAELPGGLLSERFPWLPVSAAAVAVVVLATLLVVRRRRTGAPVDAPSEDPPPGPQSEGPTLLERSLERLARLRARAPGSPDDILDWFVEGASLLREHVGESFAVRVVDRTSEELVADLADRPGASALRSLLRVCDTVKFARVRPDDDGRDRWLEQAEACLRATAPEAETP
jgi:hypothetical protein